MNIEAILASKGRAVRTVSADTAVGEAMRLMSRGLMNALVEHGTGVLERPLGDVMTRQVFTCSRGDSVGAIMAMMTDRRIRHIPVVEEDGRLCGIVSIGDVVKHHLDEVQHEAAELREYISGNT